MQFWAFPASCSFLMGLPWIFSSVSRQEGLEGLGAEGLSQGGVTSCMDCLVFWVDSYGRRVDFQTGWNQPNTRCGWIGGVSLLSHKDTRIFYCFNWDSLRRYNLLRSWVWRERGTHQLVAKWYEYQVNSRKASPLIRDSDLSALRSEWLTWLEILVQGQKLLLIQIFLPS